LEEANGEARRHIKIQATAEAQSEIRLANEIYRAEVIRFDEAGIGDANQSVNKPADLAAADSELGSKQGLAGDDAVVQVAKNRSKRRPSRLDAEIH